MSVTIFCCYGHEDEDLLKKLKTHLLPFKRQLLIDLWHDRLFQTIIEAARSHVAEVVYKWQPTRKAVKDCSPDLEHLFEVVISKEMALGTLKY